MTLLDMYRTGDLRHLCPACHGGSTGERSFVVWPDGDGLPVMLGRCYRASCFHFIREDVSSGAVLNTPVFEPKPLRLPYHRPEFALFGERVLIEDPTTTVWQLYDINGRRTGHVLRTVDKNIRMFKEIPEPVYYSNGLRPYKSLWVFEDCKSAALCREPAVALLGTNLPVSLLDHLTALNKPWPVVFVALDPGAEEAGEKVHRRLREAGIEAVFVPMVDDFKDMPEIDRETLLETYSR